MVPNSVSKPSCDRAFAKVSLQWVLIIPFVLQVVGAVGLVTYFSYRSGQQAVENLASQLLKEVSQRVSDRLNGYLDIPQKTVAGNRLAIQQETLNLSDAERLRRHLWQQMTLNPLLASNQFLAEKGQLIGYGRLLSPEKQRYVIKFAGKTIRLGTLYFIEVKEDRPDVRNFYLVDIKGQPQKLIYTAKVGDFRQLPWYQQTKSVKQQRWLPISVNPIAPYLQIIQVAPADRSPGEWEGIFLSNQPLPEFSSYLNQLHFSPTGQAFIIEHSGILVATSTSEKLAVKQLGGQVTPLLAVNSTDILTREISKYLSQTFDRFQTLNSTQQLNLVVDRQRLFVQVTPYQKKEGLDWFLVTVVPESDFMGEISQNLQRTILLCGLTFVSATAIGLLTAYCIAQPIRWLSRASQALAEGRWETSLESENPIANRVPFRITELYLLNQSFTQTAEQLQYSFEQIRVALQESEEKFTKVFLACPDPIAITSLEDGQRYLDVNDSFLQLTEYTREELIGRSPTELNIFVDWQQHTAVLKLLRLQGRVQEFEYHYRAKSGKIAIALLSLELVELDGQSRILIVAKDISDRKLMEHQLQSANEELERRVNERTQELTATNVQLQQQILQNQEVQQRLAFQFNILSQVREAVIATDREQRITYWNHAAEQLYGFKAEEVLGRLVKEVNQYQWLQPEYEQIAYHSLQETGSWQGENIHLKASGESIYVEALVSTLKDEQGENIGLLALIRNISDRKQVKAKLRDVLDSANAGIIGYRLKTVQDFEYEYCSSGCQTIFGYTQEELLADKQLWMSRVHPEDMNIMESALKNIISINKTSFLNVFSSTCDYRFYHKDNSLRWISATYTAHWDEPTNSWSVTGVNIDVKEKKQLEEQFYRAQRMESLGTLASGIAHDLNNIFTPILMITQLMSLKSIDRQDDELNLVQIVEQSAKRGAELVKQTLAFARGTEGKPISLRVEYLLLEISKVIKQTFPKSIEIQADIRKDIVGLVYADPTQLHQVFMNLVVNARDAMPDGGILNISIEHLLIDATYAEMHLDAREGPYMVITISDTGMGIKAEILDRIFDPFFTTKEIGKGTGLGLSTVLTIVKKHGGFVQVLSEVGKGTEFKIFLPIMKGTEVQVAEAGILASGNGELILIVDDELAVQQVVEKLLIAYKYKTLVASDGIEALAIYAKHEDEIKIVLLNIILPNLDGIATIRILRKMNPEIHIVAVSGLPENQEKALSEGANIFLQKPYTGEDLLKILRDIMPIILPVKTEEKNYKVVEAVASEEIKIERLSELLEKLRVQEETIWPQLQGKMKRRELQAFASLLKQWASDHHCQTLQAYATILETQIQSFDWGKIPETIQQFPQVRESLIETYGSHREIP